MDMFSKGKSIFEPFDSYWTFLFCSLHLLMLRQQLLLFQEVNLKLESLHSNDDIDTDIDTDQYYSAY